MGGPRASKGGAEFEGAMDSDGFVRCSRMSAGRRSATAVRATVAKPFDSNRSVHSTLAPQQHNSTCDRGESDLLTEMRGERLQNSLPGAGFLCSAR